MSESNLIPSLDKLTAVEYIPSGRFGVEHSHPDQQEAARRDVTEALAAAATINRASQNQEQPVTATSPETLAMPEMLPLDYTRMASSNLAIVRQAAQSDFDLAA